MFVDRMRPDNVNKFDVGGERKRSGALTFWCATLAARGRGLTETWIPASLARSHDMRQLFRTLRQQAVSVHASLWINKFSDFRRTTTEPYRPPRRTTQAISPPVRPDPNPNYYEETPQGNRVPTSRPVSKPSQAELSTNDGRKIFSVSGLCFQSISHKFYVKL